MNYQLTLDEIAKILNPEKNSKDNTLITGISYDSRQVEEGDIFVCLIGEKTDGHNYIKDAETKSAKAILASKEITSKLPIIYVKDTQIAIATLSNIFFQEPSKKIRITGVTGTNGKTTTTHLIQHILEHNNLNTAVIGTLGTRETTQSDYYEAKHTTPQAPELQNQLAKLHEKGFNHIAMEVSSHALSLHRVHGCNFSSAVLTNVTQDHLDFHLTMDEYYESKKKLFEMLNNSVHKNKHAIINNDDKWAPGFKDTIKNTVKLLTYGINTKSDFMAKDISFSSNGLTFLLLTPRGEFKITSKLNGLFNVYNLLAAIAISYAEGISLSKITDAVSSANPVDGRFQIVASEKNKNAPMCIVDYAHTPDGLENILKAAKLIKDEKTKQNKTSKLICVFGCGGDRDPTKRPKMGKIAEELSDTVIVTSDNPRTEDPNQIISDILSGIKNTSNITVEPDRKNAIEVAIKNAHKDDVVVIAGKGHEDYQILKDRTIHFDDREEVKRALDECSSLRGTK